MNYKFLNQDEIDKLKKQVMMDNISGTHHSVMEPFVLTGPQNLDVREVVKEILSGSLSLEEVDELTMQAINKELGKVFAGRFTMPDYPVPFESEFEKMLNASPISKHNRNVCEEILSLLDKERSLPDNFLKTQKILDLMEILDLMGDESAFENSDGNIGDSE